MNVWVVDEQHGETRDAERRREMQRTDSPVASDSAGGGRRLDIWVKSAEVAVACRFHDEEEPQHEGPEPHSNLTRERRNGVLRRASRL